jgi:hypothetical protein
MSIVNKVIPYLGNDGLEFRDGHVIYRFKKFDDAEYFYIDFLLGKHLVLLKDALPKSIIDKIKAKRVTLILSNCHEAFHHVVDGIYEHAILGLGLPPSQIILYSESVDIRQEVEIVANKLNLEQIRCEWMRIFEHGIQQQVIYNDEYKNPITLENKDYTKKFLNFNRRWRPHRPAFVAFLACHNLLDSGHVSLALSDDNTNWDKAWYDVVAIHKKSLQELELLLSNKDKILNLPPLYLDRTDLERNHVTLLPSTKQLYRNTYFSVVSETNYYEYLGVGRFLSEKVFKPIAQQHPFIILGRPGSLEALRSIGYKTFNGLIDESYDREIDDIKRMGMVIKEVNRLCELDKRSLTIFLKEAKKICIDNYNILLNKTEFLTKL